VNSDGGSDQVVGDVTLVPCPRPAARLRANNRRILLPERVVHVRRPNMHVLRICFRCRKPNKLIHISVVRANYCTKAKDRGFWPRDSHARPTPSVGVCWDATSPLMGIFNFSNEFG
jgi:hypothetical protein